MIEAQSGKMCSMLCLFNWFIPGKNAWTRREWRSLLFSIRTQSDRISYATMMLLHSTIAGCTIGYSRVYADSKTDGQSASCFLDVLDTTNASKRFVTYYIFRSSRAFEHLAIEFLSLSSRGTCVRLFMQLHLCTHLNMLFTRHTELVYGYT